MLSQRDFIRVGDHYVTAIDGFHLSVEPTKTGFRLVTYGTLVDDSDMTKHTKEPTPDQWDSLLRTANKFGAALMTAKERQ